MSTGHRRYIHAWTLAALTAMAAIYPWGNADAQQWPQRPVKFITSFGPGSSADTSARIVAERLQAVWKQSIVVEPRPGGDAMMAINAFISANDDHTFFFGPSSSFVAHPHRYAKLSYDRARDILPSPRCLRRCWPSRFPASRNGNR